MGSRFFPYDNTTYSGDDFRAYTSPRSTGVYAAPGHFDATTAGNQVTIDTGAAWLKFDKLKGGSYTLPTPETLDVPAITGAQVARLFIGADVFQNDDWCEFRVGANANDSAIQPVRNNMVCEVAPYDVKIVNGLYQLVDNRLDESLCGMMKSEVEGIPTQQIVDDVNALLAQLQEAYNGIVSREGLMLMTDYDPTGEVGAVGIPEYVENALGSDEGFTTYIHSKSGTVHTLTNPDGGSNIKFKATADFAAGNTFRVNGTNIATVKGTPSFTSGETVMAFLDGTTINFKSAGGGGFGLIVVGGASEPTSPKEDTVWAYTDITIGSVLYGNIVPGYSTVDAGDIFVVCGPSNVEVKSADGKVSVSPMYVLQRQGSTWVPLAAVIWQNNQWQMFYPTNGLVNYCTGADYVNQVDGVAGNATGVSIVTDATAGPVLATTYANTTTLNWPSALYAAGLRRGTMIGAFKTTYNHTNQGYVCSCGSASTGSIMGIGLSPNEYAQCHGATNAAILSTPMNDGNWHVVSGVFDYDTQTSEKVIVRDESGNKATNTGNTLTTGNSFSIGNRASSPANVHVVVGNIAQVFFYQRALSEYEAQALTATIHNKVKGVF